jgi:hypothetical protein
MEAIRPIKGRHILDIPYPVRAVFVIISPPERGASLTKPGGRSLEAGFEPGNNPASP